VNCFDIYECIGEGLLARLVADSNLVGKAFVILGDQTPSTHIADIPGSSRLRTGEATDS